MSESTIFSVIAIVDKFGSAIDENALHELLPVPIENKDFHLHLNRLESSGKISRRNNLFTLSNQKQNHIKNQTFSREIFNSNRVILKRFSRLPWVRFMGLTGSNAFESCSKKDDIDLFVVCTKDRLWISYFLMALLSKILNKRSVLCLNYLIDEEHLLLPQENYYSAVQFLKMKPLFNADIKQKIFNANPWIKDNLPNAGEQFKTEDFYKLRSDFIGQTSQGIILKKINQAIYNFYRMRWSKKYPDSFGKSIILGKGIAKLHRNDNSRIYTNIEESNT